MHFEHIEFCVLWLQLLWPLFDSISQFTLKKNFFSPSSAIMETLMGLVVLLICAELVIVVLRNLFSHLSYI